MSSPTDTSRPPHHQPPDPGSSGSDDPRADLPVYLCPLVAAHDAMRRDAGRLRRAVEAGTTLPDRSQLATWFDRVAGVIEHHHHCEDTIVWPGVERFVPEFDADAHQLHAEHGDLDVAIAQVRASLRGTGDPVEASRRFDQVLDGHLTREEALILRLIRDCLGADGFGPIEEQVNRTAGLGMAAFALPWVLDDADPQLRAVIEDGLPAPFRVLHSLVWRRRYRRAVPSCLGVGR